MLLNGAFGIGKTTAARALVGRVSGAVLFDPEHVGFVLRRIPRPAGRRPADYQDLASWRRLTVRGASLVRHLRPLVVMPMAFDRTEILGEIRDGLRRCDPDVRHLCLTAPLEVVEGRIARRGDRDARRAWVRRRAAECCAAHAGDAFAERVPTEGRTAEQVVDELVRRLLRVEPLAALPGGFEALRRASEREGFAMLTRLRDAFASGESRFDGRGEALLAAWVGPVLVGVGGVHRDPYAGDPDVGRVRHFYVAAGVRRAGVGTELLGALRGAARSKFTRLRLRTNTERGARFYEASGFPAVREAAATHRLDAPF